LWAACFFFAVDQACWPAHPEKAGAPACAPR
jgi:hypothetical protein